MKRGAITSGGTSTMGTSTMGTSTMLAIACVAFAGPLAHADSADSVRPPAMSKRQMIVKTVGCMRKRMAVDRAISYNEAARTCKAQVDKLSDNSPPGVQPPAFAITTNP